MRPWCASQIRSASLGVGGLEHGVALHGQDLAGERAHALVVLDEQDRLRAAPPGAGRPRPPRATAIASLDPRQVDLEGRALPRLAVHPRCAAALLDDAVDGRQAQPGALARLLGGEERLEDARLRRPRPCRCRCRVTASIT